MSELKLVILGAGGHGKVCAEIASALNHFDSIVFSDDGMDRGTQVLQWSVQFHDKDLPALDHSGMEFVIGLGQTGSGAGRERLYTWLQSLGVTITTLISGTAVVSRSASIGIGTVIGNMALVQPSAEVGQNCIVNSRALIEHDTRIGDHVHVSTGAIINGGTTIGDRCLIGSGAVVNHSVSICRGTIIGSGAAVLGDIAEPGIYVGVPARKIRDAR